MLSHTCGLSGYADCKSLSGKGINTGKITRVYAHGAADTV